LFRLAIQQWFGYKQARLFIFDFKGLYSWRRLSNGLGKQVSLQKIDTPLLQA
jgi:hypothetical protein